MTDRYIVQRLDGSTVGGRDSWIMVNGFRCVFPSKEMAQVAMKDHADRNPAVKYRVRKLYRRR